MEAKAIQFLLFLTVSVNVTLGLIFSKINPVSTAWQDRYVKTVRGNYFVIQIHEWLRSLIKRAIRKSIFKILISTVLFGFAIVTETEAAFVKSVQRDSATFAFGQNTLPVTLTAVDPSKTIVWGGINWGGGRIGSSNANATRVGFELASDTTLNLQRLGSPTQATVVEWQAIEFVSGVLVQRGATSFGASDITVNVAIGSVNLSESFVLISVATGSGSATTDERWTVWARLTSSTNLELARSETGTAITVYWQVVSINSASVQRGLAIIGAGTSSATAAISSINTAASFLLFTQRAAAASNGIEAEYQVRGRITSSTQLTFDRISTANSVDIAWQVVTLNDGSSVQSGNVSVGSAATSGTASLGAVNTSRTATFINVRGGNTGGNSTGRLDETSFTHNLTNSTTLTVTRGGIGTAADVAWFVVQFVVNQPPVLDSIGPKFTDENQLLQFRVSATDPDLTTPSLSAVNLPAGATFVDSLNGAGSFNWTPSFTQAGVYNVTFAASDSGLADSEIVSITVNNVNLAPMLDSIGSKSVAEGYNLTFRVHATDPDGDSIILTATNVPVNATFVDSGNGSGSFTFTPDTLQVGVYNVIFISADSVLADSETVEITVLDCMAKPGDLTGDGKISPGDIVYLINYYFKTGPAPSPPCSGDVNASGNITSGDIIYLINYYFKLGPAPLRSGVCCL